jgi:hypothetical protein
MKEQYINMRNRKVVDPAVLYTFAVDQGATITFQEFAFALQFVDINYIIDFMDIRLGLTKLHDKLDNFIKIVE